jgi:dTDP-4-dehydrorhamnose reductase
VAVLEAAAGGVVHVVNQGEASRFELARATLRLAGEDADKIVPTTQARMRRRARRPIYSVLSTARYAEWVGEPLRHWEAALAEHLAVKRTSEATR